MKTQLSIALALALAPTLALAAPDFSGAWVRDAAKSDPANYPVYWLTRVAPGAGGGGNQEQVVEIRQTGASLVVVNPARPVRTYALDGKAHVTATDNGLQKAAITAAVQDDGLTITTAQPYGSMPGNVAATFTDTWRLSADGKVLTITTVRDTPARRQESKEVFNRR
jgi:hypothetical protein